MSATTRTGAMPSTTDILAEYARLGLRPISGGDGTDDDAAAKAAADAKAAEEKAAAEAKAKADADETAKLGDAGKKALDAEREARSAAERRAKETEKELAALRKKAQEEEAAKAKAAEEEAARKGEFEKLATERAETIGKVTTERDDYKTRYESALAQIAPGVAADWKALPAEVGAMYDGAEDDLLAKAAFLAKTKALTQALTQQSPTGPRVPGTPRPNGATGPAVAPLVNRATI